MKQQQIAHNIARIRERIEQASRRAGRSVDEVTLIGVTKTHPAEIVAAAVEAGVHDFGENRVQEAEEKIQHFHERTARWHLIGHLQRNKAKRAAALFDMIHSLDNVRLAEALDRHVVEGARATRLPVLLQVNVSGEETKEGFALPRGSDNHAAFPKFLAAVEHIAALPHLDVQGLMTIAPYSFDAEDARPIFRALRQLRDHLAGQFPAVEWRHLSMGMTGDFEVAIEEGATLVRVGRAIFGERS